MAQLDIQGQSQQLAMAGLRKFSLLFQQQLFQHCFRPCNRLGSIRKEHSGGGILRQSGPQGQRISVAVKAVGIAGFDVVTPVIAHLSRKVVVLAGKGAPALGQRFRRTTDPPNGRYRDDPSREFRDQSYRHTAAGRCHSAGFSGWQYEWHSRWYAPRRPLRCFPG